MRDINVLEQRLCLHVPRVVLGGVIQGKAETKTVRLPVSPDFCSEAAVSPYSQRSLHPTWAAPPTPLRFPRAARTVPGPGQECQTNRLRYGVELLKLQNRNVTEK